MHNPSIHQLYIGKVKELGDPHSTDKMDRPWTSGMFKTPVQTAVWLSETGFIGDEVADKKNHGGPEKAVFAYPAQHYRDWQEELGRDDQVMFPGAMGENFSVIHMDETTVCIGDTYQCGEAVIQVSQPRRPCWKPARRFRILDMALRIQHSGKTGWYYRVLKSGYVQAGDVFELLDRPYEEWTIAASNRVMYEGKKDIDQTRALASCDRLAENWKRTLDKRLQGIETSSDKRVFGPNR
ncbi:MOSC domain-containing protein [Lentibacillus saliphilus]|uniref:MOSC domain-containing protein n=1 Tax=Lentibacillus saliphilus TaxID=2737028 RepID=UPI001C30B02C|nr:MOSC domain-containing protein [Lentibacillus saliphilus]